MPATKTAVPTKTAVAMKTAVATRTAVAMKTDAVTLAAAPLYTLNRRNRWVYSREPRPARAHT
jgi:hypothetical protein